MTACAILIAGGLPTELGPENDVAWTETGLRLEGPSQVIAEDAVWLDTGEFTLEVWLRPDVLSGAGNREIVSFVDGPGVRPLVLGQWPEGLLLRSRIDNPKGMPSRDRYGRLAVAPASDQVARHLAVVGRGDEARLHVDGASTDVVVSNPDVPLGGRLLLGSSATGWTDWHGEIRALALHDRALGTAELARRARAGPGSPDRGASADRLIALYLFEPALEDAQPSGVPEDIRIESRKRDAPALLVPARVSPPSPPVLRFMLSMQRNWFRRDVALNFVGFVPLGLLIGWRRGLPGVGLAIAGGLVLSLVVELGQVWIPGRHSSLIDLITNTLGATFGGLLALWLAPSQQDAISRRESLLVELPDEG